jgi:hypothetical protein
VQDRIRSPQEDAATARAWLGDGLRISRLCQGVAGGSVLGPVRSTINADYETSGALDRSGLPTTRRVARKGSHEPRCLAVQPKGADSNLASHRDRLRGCGVCCKHAVANASEPKRATQPALRRTGPGTRHNLHGGGIAQVCRQPALTCVGSAARHTVDRPPNRGRRPSDACTSDQGCRASPTSIRRGREVSATCSGDTRESRPHRPRDGKGPSPSANGPTACQGTLYLFRRPQERTHHWSPNLNVPMNCSHRAGMGDRASVSRC